MPTPFPLYPLFPLFPPFRLLLQFARRRRDTQQSVNATVSATTRDLRRLQIIVRKGDKRQKLQFEKLAQNFSESVVRYSQVQKVPTILPHTLPTAILAPCKRTFV